MDVPLRPKTSRSRPRRARAVPPDAHATRPTRPRRSPIGHDGSGRSVPATRGRGRARGADGDGCWVDLYEQAFLGGRVRRVHGPGEFHGLAVASLIAGPSAHVELMSGSTPNRVILPLRIEADLGRGLRNQAGISIRLKKTK